MNQPKIPSDFTGFNALLLTLAMLVIAFSVAAPGVVNLVPWGPSPNPYAVVK